MGKETHDRVNGRLGRLAMWVPVGMVVLFLITLWPAQALFGRQNAPVPLPAGPSTLLQSPFEGMIAFRSDREGGGFFVMSPDGGDVRRLQDAAFYARAEGREPFAPDGRRRAVVRRVDGVGDLWVEDVQAGWSEPVVTGPDDEMDPVWSPGGERIAYVAILPGGEEALRVVHVETGQVQEVLRWSNARVRHPSWSPDGRRLAFWSDREGGRRQIWVVRLETGQVKRVGRSPNNDWDPVWIKPVAAPRATPTPGGPDDVRLRLVSAPCAEQADVLVTVEATDVTGVLTRLTVEVDGTLIFDTGPVRLNTITRSIRLSAPVPDAALRAEVVARAWNEGYFSETPKERRTVIVCRPVRRVVAPFTIPTPPFPTPTLTPTPSPTPTPSGPTPTPYPPEALVGSILFWSDRDGEPALYVMDPDGRRQRRLEGPWAELYYEEAAKADVVSPDGRLIAYSDEEAADFDLFIYNLREGWAWQVTEGPALEYEPAWSPDGRTVAFTSREGGQDRIFLVTVTGGDVRPLTGSLEGQSRRPSWSPDGRRVAFTYEENGRTQIWTIGADGRGPRNISRSEANDWGAVWVKRPPRPAELPPTTFIVITSTPTPQNVFVAATRVALATLQATTTGTPTPLPPNAVTATPTFTPLVVTATPTPGNRATATAVRLLATAVAATTGTPTPLPAGAWVVTATPTPTPTPTPTLTPTPTPTPTPVFIYLADLTPTPRRSGPTPTPTGIPDVLRGKILFKSDRLGREAIFMMDPDGSNVALLTNPWPYEWALEQERLSPDGRRRVFVKFVNRAYQLFIFDAALGVEVQLTRFGERTRAWAPSWSPLGDRIAFTSNDSGNDEIWVINVDGSRAVHITDNTWEWDHHPSWSPDGSQIVFSSNRVTGWRNIWVMDADGGNPRNLSGWCECNDWDPVWVKD